MDNGSGRGSVSNVAGACIIAAGLVSAALIVAHRPPAPAAVVAASAKMTAEPPIAQASVAQQFQAQTLAAPSLHTFRYQGVTHTLVNVNVSQVLYDPKNDDFTIEYNFVWQPAMPATGPTSDTASLSNDGYGHYYGIIVLSPGVGDSSQHADVTIR